jgi:uncharacterized glyoxalase superfamily protein PhnB
MAQPDLVGMVMRDMACRAALLSFARTEHSPNMNTEPHVEVVLPGGFRIAWDSLEMITGIDPEWIEPVGQWITLAFKCESPADVDALYEQVLQNGYGGHKAPWDAFWGQRYAVVDDPDGNRVDLFAGL